MNKFSLEGLHVNNLIEISITAGKAIMEIYKSDFNINLKSDKSPLTQADILSNDIIISSLNKITPNTPIISEESSNISFEERCKWKEYWLIDPLDGTKEFIKKNGEFTVNIALIENHQPIAGVVYAPAIDELYFSDIENGAFLTTGKNSHHLESAIENGVKIPSEQPSLLASSRRNNQLGREACHL